MSLKAELNRMRRQLATLPPDGTGGKTVLPFRVWGCIAGAIPWDDLTPDERAVWDEFREWAERQRAEALAKSQAILATLGTPNPMET